MPAVELLGATPVLCVDKTGTLTMNRMTMRRLWVVPAAISECHAAEIRVVMITGDHPQTALSIARQAGLVADGECLTGPQIDALDEAALFG